MPFDLDLQGGSRAEQLVPIGVSICGQLVWVHAMQAAQVEPSSLSHKGLAGWLGWLAGWLWVQGRRPYAKPGSQCLKGADWLAGTS